MDSWLLFIQVIRPITSFCCLELISLPNSKLHVLGPLTTLDVYQGLSRHVAGQRDLVSPQVLLSPIPTCGSLHMWLADQEKVGGHSPKLAYICCSKRQVQ